MKNLRKWTAAIILYLEQKCGYEEKTGVLRGIYCKCFFTSFFVEETSTKFSPIS